KRMPNIIRHIQSPAINTMSHTFIHRVHPPPGGIENIFLWPSNNTRTVFSQFRQCFYSEPSFVIELGSFSSILPACDDEPILIHGFLLIFYYVLESKILYTEVIEHTIKDDIHLSFMYFIDQLQR